MNTQPWKHALVFIICILVIATIMSFHFASNLLISGIGLTSCLEFAGSLAIFISAIFLLKDFREKQ
ncbi:MAG: hypothetical protein ABF545_04430 [Bifidobacterium psychraerophilum]|uniref:hypothetical protein n=1 Tax=Bifidobacterium psychraerophilum TaxID=218140 RepID=UPI0039E9B1B5